MSEGRAVANVAASATDTELVAARDGKKIRVTGLALSPGGTATVVTLKSKGAGAAVAVTPAFALGINLPLVLPNDAGGWFETAAGEALTVTTGAGSTTGILVNYDYR